jgi:VWFA-related protein
MQCDRTASGRRLRGMRSLMKKGIVLSAAIWLAFGGNPSASQDRTAVQQHESVVVNIEVPVRVFKRNVFVDGLTLQDFEVYEDGVRQQIEAVYLIRDRHVLKEEKTTASAPPPPAGNRHFILYLDLKEYMSKAGSALDYFFADVLSPGDSLSVVTPAKSYRFKPEALDRIKPREISDSLKSKLKKDIQTGNTLYRTMMRDFYRLEEEEWPAEMAELKEMRLFDLALQMRDLTSVSEKQVLAFAEDLKALDGEKHVFLVFQKDVLPDHAFAWEKETELIRSFNFDIEKIKRIYADASITIHFLYITKTPAFAVKGASVGRTSNSFSQQDLSSDIYSAFKDMAKATGGVTENTNNPDFGLRHAAEASSNYYLLCYRPLNYKADGTFKKIEVKVRGSGLDVTHRMGYIAD